uniref:Pleiotropic drug resistance protein 12 n=1 Tax=Aegilops tauschii TaxID=37682 RepID=M8B5A2_AEGTA
MGITGAGKTTLLDVLARRKTGGYIEGATGLSAEQRKRRTLAVELVASPSIIFMDDSTAGLDPCATAIVMRTIRKTVDTGRTVVCTIHQPSIGIFESFDEVRLLLMKRGGQIIYSGSLGPLSSNMIKYFEGIPSVPRIKEGPNPASWVLDISSHTTEYDIGVDYAEIYRSSDLYRTQQQDVFNILGVVSGSTLFLGFSNCTSLQPVVIMERVVLYREKAAGMYSTLAYTIAQMAIELPYILVQVLVFASTVYPMIGFQMTTVKFFWFVLYMMLSFMYYTLYGMMTLALTPNHEMAAGLSFLIYVFWNVFSGFIIGREVSPKVLVGWRISRLGFVTPIGRREKTKLKDVSSNNADWIRDLRIILSAAQKNYVLDAQLGDGPIAGAYADVMNVWQSSV